MRALINRTPVSTSTKLTKIKFCRAEWPMMISLRSVPECSVSSKIRARDQQIPSVLLERKDRAWPHLLSLFSDSIQIRETSCAKCYHPLATARSAPGPHEARFPRDTPLSRGEPPPRGAGPASSTIETCAIIIMIVLRARKRRGGTRRTSRPTHLERRNRDRFSRVNVMVRLGW